MNSQPSSRHLFPRPEVALALTLAILLLSLTGCARKPWRESLEGQQAQDIRKIVSSMQQRDTDCPPCIDADVKIQIENHLSDRTFHGYVQLRLPTFIKYISTNPFGQPVLLLTSDGTSFQWLNTLEKNYLAGSIASYGFHNDIPQFFLRAPWGNWLTGRLEKDEIKVADIRQDELQRGLWVSTLLQDAATAYQEHLLIDPTRQLLLSRIITDPEGTILTRISYDNWQDISGCLQPANIVMTDLAFGGEITVLFQETADLEVCPVQSFTLPVPKGFNRQFLP